MHMIESALLLRPDFGWEEWREQAAAQKWHITPT